MRRNPVPAEQLGVLLPTRDALAAGISRSRLRAADVGRPFRGVIVIGEVGDSLEERCRALRPLLRPGWAFSHWTAAALHGGALPTRRDELLHVAVVAPGTPPRRAGVRGHRVAGMRVECVRGLPVASAGDTWVQLGAHLALRDLAALGDSLLPARHRTGAVSRASLVTALGHRNHSYGIRAARRALPLLRESVDSRPETLLRLLLVDAGLPEPTIAPPVEVVPGRVLHPDLAYVDDRIAIEYEGDHHRTEAWQWHHDLERQRDYEAIDWRLLRVSSEALFHGPRRLIDVVRALRTQRARLRRFGV